LFRADGGMSDESIALGCPRPTIQPMPLFKATANPHDRGLAGRAGRKNFEHSRVAPQCHAPTRWEVTPESMVAVDIPKDVAFLAIWFSKPLSGTGRPSRFDREQTQYVLKAPLSKRFMARFTICSW
jgi:hypothetical protein